jgi:hypothetical protein
VYVIPTVPPGSEVVVMDTGVEVFVKLNVAGLVTPATVALTTYDPATPLAVALTLARPALLVIAEALDRIALAPDDGAEKVTVTPETGLPPASVTVTCSGVVKALFMAADCVVPPVAVIMAAEPVVLVNTNDAAVAAPGTDAVTV